MKAFIEDHREAYGVEPICQVLPIAPSTVYRHAARQADPSRRSARDQRDEEWMAHIRRIWDEHCQVYGARKVWRQLQREGIVVARCRVERLMRQLDLQGVVGEARRPSATRAPLVLGIRSIASSRPSGRTALWVSDLTYVSTW